MGLLVWRLLQVAVGAEKGSYKFRISGAELGTAEYDYPCIFPAIVAIVAKGVSMGVVFYMTA